MKRSIIFIDRMLRIRYVPFYKSYWLKRRKGECKRCAKCCYRKDGTHCKYLLENKTCEIHEKEWRGKVCDIDYPATPIQQCGRGIKGCGYYWIRDK